jgi:hypothetical protein
LFGWPTSCINIRFLSGGVSVGEFERRGGRVNMRVEGAIFDSSPHIVLAPLDGQSIAFLPEEEFAPYIQPPPALARVLACPGGVANVTGCWICFSTPQADKILHELPSAHSPNADEP